MEAILSVEIQSILFDRPALKALEGIPNHCLEMSGGLALGFGFDLSERSESLTAVLAASDGVIGVVIGKRKLRGAVAGTAEKRCGDLIFGQFQAS